VLNISIVIVNFNSGPFLRAALDLIQSRRRDYELIVVDNCSSDGSADFVYHRENIRLVQLGQNLGFGTAANAGAADAKGDFLLFLNPDAFVGEDTPERMAAYLTGDPKRGLCGAFLLDLRGCEQPGSRRRDPTLLRSCGKTLNSFIPCPKLPTFDAHQEMLPATPMFVQAVSGACMMVKRSVHLDIGGFDEGYFLHFEDLDYCRRARRKGWMVGFLPDVPVFHFQGVSGGVDDRFLLGQKQLGLRRYLDKFGYQGAVHKTFRGMALNVLSATATAMFRLSGKVKPRSLAETERRSDAVHILTGEVLAGKHPVVLVFGARSDVGDSLCARLNALGLVTACVSRSTGDVRSTPRTVTVEPDLLLRNRRGARLDIVAVVSVCPIWELSRFEGFLSDIRKDNQPWVVLSSTSVVTKLDSKRQEESGIAAKLRQGEAWVSTHRNAVVGPTVIVRPTLIYGGIRNRNINRIKAITLFSRIKINLRFARGLRSPVHCDDLAQWMAGFLGNELNATNNPLQGLHCVDLSGSETLSFRDMVSRAQNASGTIGLRLGFGRAVTRLCFLLICWIPFMREVPRDFLGRLESDFLFSNKDAIALKEGKFRRFYP
jgi:hypothetical protein